MGYASFPHRAEAPQHFTNQQRWAFRMGWRMAYWMAFPNSRT